MLGAAFIPEMVDGIAQWNGVEVHFRHRSVKLGPDDRINGGFHNCRNLADLPASIVEVFDRVFQHRADADGKLIRRIDLKNLFDDMAAW